MTFTFLKYFISQSALRVLGENSVPAPAIATEAIQAVVIWEMVVYANLDGREITVPRT